MIRRVFGLALIGVLMSPATAWAYSNTGFDPNDVGTVPDVRSTARVVSQENGHRTLRVIVVAYENWPNPRTGFNVNVPLDTRGGSGVDAHLFMFSGQDVACVVSRNHSRIGVKFAVRGDRIVCRAPTRLLEPTKRIRWKIIASNVRFRNPDYAPNDRGWYS